VEINEFLTERGSTEIKSSISIKDLMKRPEIEYDDLSFVDPDRPNLSQHEKTMMEVQIKYEGYIDKQNRQIEKFKKLENKKLPDDIDYNEIEGLRLEARQKLSQFRPLSVGQASRISGVSPADINVLLIHLEKLRRSR
jgi:tRNA uridine 5-carboxymethylaminomethyl modification enzyme